MENAHLFTRPVHGASTVVVSLENQSGGPCAASVATPEGPPTEMPSGSVTVGPGSSEGVFLLPRADGEVTVNLCGLSRTFRLTYAELPLLTRLFAPIFTVLIAAFVVVLNVLFSVPRFASWVMGSF